MKYIMICSIAMILCLVIGYIIARLITGNKKKTKRSFIRFLLTIVFGAVLMLAVTFVYLNIYYHAGDDAVIALEGNDLVTVTKIDGGYLFDGPGDETAFVFYPGAKVECRAYAPLMLEISQRGMDCYLADVPFNFAIFGMDRANRLLKGRDYKKLIVSGHSMGGIVAAEYAQAHPDEVDALVLMASYTSSPTDNDMQLLSIYGSEDGCLDRTEYEKDKVNWPDKSEEYIIDGGNHAQFGDYGMQKGDGTALITPKEQIGVTADKIAETVGQSEK